MRGVRASRPPMRGILPEFHGRDARATEVAAYIVSASHSICETPGGLPAGSP